MVNFWSPGEARAHRRLPAAEVADELAPRGLALVTIMMEGTQEAADRFVARTGLRAPVVIGSFELAAAYRMQVYPWTVIIGRDGKPKFSIRGGRKEAAFRSIFESYL